jgi:hypothetical protein
MQIPRKKPEPPNSVVERTAMHGLRQPWQSLHGKDEG